MQEWPRLSQSKSPPFLYSSAIRGRVNLHVVQLCFERRRHFVIPNSRPARPGEKHQHDICDGFVAAEMAAAFTEQIPAVSLFKLESRQDKSACPLDAFERRRHFAIYSRRTARSREKRQPGICFWFVDAGMAAPFAESEQTPAISLFKRKNEAG